MEPLSEARPGDVVKVVDLAVGAGLKVRLVQLGLFPGSLVEVLANDHGHVLVKARGSVVSLSRGIASKVLVERAPPGPHELRSGQRFN